MFFRSRDEMRFLFIAKRKGYVLPNGGCVIWWDWEPRQ